MKFILISDGFQQQHSVPEGGQGPEDPPLCVPQLRSPGCSFSLSLLNFVYFQSFLLAMFCKVCILVQIEEIQREFVMKKLNFSLIQNVLVQEGIYAQS